MYARLRIAAAKPFTRLIAPLLIGVAAAAEPLHIEPGLWEVDYTYSLQGEPPAAVLAQLPPEKRAAVEKSWASRVGHSKAKTSKSCVTLDEIANGTAFENGDQPSVPGCERRYATQTATRWTMVEQCNNQAGVSERDVQINASGPHTVDGTMHAVHGEGATASGLDMTFRAKWIAKACGDVK